MTKPPVTVLIPAYNEEKTIGEVVNGVKKQFKKSGNPFEIIVIDDGSTDRTASIVNGMRGVVLLRHYPNRGYGAALKTGLRNAKNEWILIIDADGTYPTESIPRLLKHFGEYDMVVGARTGEKIHTPFLRKPAKFVISKLANFIASEKMPDLNSGMRGFRKDLAMKFFKLFPGGFSFTTTITLAALCNNYNVKYVPINYKKRIGKSSMKAYNFIGFIVLLFKMTMYFKPLKVMMPITVILFLWALGVIINSIYYTGNITELGVILFLISLQVGILSMLADVIVKSR